MRLFLVLLGIVYAFAQGRSDPDVRVKVITGQEGIDLKPYALSLETAIRRQWVKAWPRETVQATVTLRVAIEKSGDVAKISVVSLSGHKALDRAAISAISNCNPFAPVPPRYEGKRLVVEVAFHYDGHGPPAG
jgi:TonB family protein